MAAAQNSPPRIVVGAQVRAARALLNLSAQDLADLTKLSRSTIQRAELETGEITAANSERIVEALEKQGVIFLADDEEGPGVRLRKRRKR